MSDSSDRPRRRSRRLTADERALWRTITRSVAPLRPGETAVPEPEQEQPPLPASESPRAGPPERRTAERSQPAAPPLAPLGRRLKQRVARGVEPIDARLDLHGLTQEEAHNVLRRFLRNAQADGAKLVLVITGKGGQEDGLTGSGRGVLKRLVPQWLRLPEFRSYIVGFDVAHGRQGGEGALYVRLRRAQR